MQASAIASQEKRARHPPVPFGVVRSTIGCSANNPDVTFFQLLDQLNKICDTSNGNVFQGPCCRFCYGCGQPHRASLRNENSAYAGALRCSQNCSKIARILTASNPRISGGVAVPTWELNSSRSSPASR